MMKNNDSVCSLNWGEMSGLKWTFRFIWPYVGVTILSEGTLVRGARRRKGETERMSECPASSRTWWKRGFLLKKWCTAVDNVSLIWQMGRFFRRGFDFLCSFVWFCRYFRCECKKIVLNLQMNKEEGGLWTHVIIDCSTSRWPCLWWLVARQNDATADDDHPPRTIERKTRFFFNYKRFN